jgi:hypothetical protein
MLSGGDGPGAHDADAVVSRDGFAKSVLRMTVASERVAGWVVAPLNHPLQRMALRVRR